jgi:hypothetical protein
VRPSRVTERRLVRATALAAVVLCPIAAQAQTVSFDQLPRELEPGDRVIVTDAAGEHWKGRIATITPDGMVLSGRESSPFRVDDIRKIRRTDTLWNGFLIGAAIGAASIPVWQRAECGSNDSECATIVGAVGLVTLVPAGAVAGLLTDRFIMRTVYLAPGETASVMFTPFARRGGGGLSVAVTF